MTPPNDNNAAANQIAAEMRGIRVEPVQEQASYTMKVNRYAPAFPETLVPFHGSNAGLMNQIAGSTTESYIREGIDYREDRLFYGYDGQFLVSGHDQVRVNNLPSGLKIDPDAKIVLASPISREGMKRHLAKNYQVDITRLLGALAEKFRTHAIVPEGFLPEVLAHWTLGTYLYMAFQYYPYLWIKSDRENSGKSRLTRILAHLCFRAGGAPQINPTPAVIYRAVDQEGQTFIVDEFDNIAEQTKDVLMGVLNGGFERGGTVPRCDQQKNYDVKKMNAYGPKVFAGLEMPLPRTFQSRTIPIYMLPKKPDEQILPFDPTVDLELGRELQFLRDDMGVWALENAKACATAALKRDALGMPATAINRLEDIMVPLHALAQVAGTDCKPFAALCEYLIEMKMDQQENAKGKLIRVLGSFLPREQDTIRKYTADLVVAFEQGGSELERALSSQTHA